MGLDQAKEISARLDGLLQKQGPDPGHGRRANPFALQGESVPSTTPTPMRAAVNSFSDTCATGFLEAVKKRLPMMFDRIPDQEIEVRRVPPAIDVRGAVAPYSEEAVARPLAAGG